MSAFKYFVSALLCLMGWMVMTSRVLKSFFLLLMTLCRFSKNPLADVNVQIDFKLM